MKKNIYFGIIFLTLFIITLALSQPQTTESPPLPISVDVVVVGRGLPALAAALEANRQGAEVMILDSQQLREDFFYPLGGSFIVAQAKETGREEEERNTFAGLADMETVMEQIMAFAPKTNRVNLQKVLTETAATLNWLSAYLDLDLKTRPPDNLRFFSPFFDNTALLEERLWQLLQLRLIHILEGAEPLAIDFSPAGEVRGMEIATDKGVVTVTTRAVILAAGGFSGNKDYLAEYFPLATRLDCSLRTGGIKGIALDLVKGIEADIIKGQRLFLAPVLFPSQQLIDRSRYPDLLEAVWLDRYGENITAGALEILRTGSETDMAAWLLNLAGQPLYLLFPGNRGAVFPGLIPVVSLSELSSRTGISAVDLAAVLAGDPPPYYLATLELQPLYTMGGLAADGQGRILKQGAPVPGLYGAGETVGWLHGERIFPGLPLTEGLVMGRITGREAASYARK